MLMLGRLVLTDYKDQTRNDNGLLCGTKEIGFEKNDVKICPPHKLCGCRAPQPTQTMTVLDGHIKKRSRSPQVGKKLGAKTKSWNHVNWCSMTKEKINRGTTHRNKTTQAGTRKKSPAMHHIGRNQKWETRWGKPSQTDETE